MLINFYFRDVIAFKTILSCSLWNVFIKEKLIMKNKTFSRFRSLIILLAFFIAFGYGCSNDKESDLGHSNYLSSEGYEKGKKSDTFKNNEIAVEAPPFTEGIFPCTDCHIDIEPNPIKRSLIDMHDDIDIVFDHDSDNRWCLDCHDLNNRDSLKLASGKRIGFDESYKLCGQCHGDKLRDWKVGVHGKRTGDWNGEKHYLLCVHCHNPHSPKFEPMIPMPPPFRQENIY